MRTLLMLFISISLLSGCAMEKEQIIENNLAQEPGHYIVLIVVENENSLIEIDEWDVSGTLSELTPTHSERIFQVVQTWDRGDWNYTRAFDIEAYPTFLVFDTTDLVLQTTEFQELKQFVSEDD